MNKLIVAALIAGLSGNVYAGVDVSSDAGNQNGARSVSTNPGDGSDRGFVFSIKPSAGTTTGSQPAIGSGRSHILCDSSDVGNR